MWYGPSVGVGLTRANGRRDVPGSTDSSTYDTPIASIRIGETLRDGWTQGKEEGESLTGDGTAPLFPLGREAQHPDLCSDQATRFGFPFGRAPSSVSALPSSSLLPSVPGWLLAWPLAHHHQRCI